MARTRKAGKIGGVPYVIEVVDAQRLRPHPRNYKAHPEEQLEHIGALLKEFGFFKNVVAARDYTLLAGHGVVEAAKRVGMGGAVPVRVLDLAADDPLAMKVLAADNELGKFAETDDRALSLMLKDIRDSGPRGLLGTGYDDQRLAALLMVTRPASEISNIDEAAEWVGMPDYDGGEAQIKLVITFPTEVDRKRFVDAQQMKIVKIAGLTWSTRWPAVENEDVHSLKFRARR